MKKLCILLLLAGCASAPLTEDERFKREYEEADRINLYIMWEQQCRESGGVIFSYDVRHCVATGRCKPSKWDWKYDSKRERPYFGNRIVCMSPSAVREIFR